MKSLQAAGSFSFSDPGGWKEKCSPSLALLPKSSAIPFSFELHTCCEPCPKRETGQKSRVREKDRSGARHTSPPSKGSRSHLNKENVIEEAIAALFDCPSELCLQHALLVTAEFTAVEAQGSGHQRTDGREGLPHVDL